jgi:uncharacterized protein (UPF0305 family)
MEDEKRLLTERARLLTERQDKDGVSNKIANLNKELKDLGLSDIDFDASPELIAEAVDAKKEQLNKLISKQEEEEEQFNGL